ncbi:carbamate kinase [Vibrio vulnificus]|uniref:carbamate kinase n=1 Tax=Vibrio vulnificus TaxID=672 RepID=UPI001FAD64F3|nr:carbamate kinase [Vibrio vulnificus]EKO3839135.1 carbamate kinase [Vibrio harveyi]MCJ0821006.1 carbamate kinase [Vibrio vulnificus]HDY7936770.1 carbamate kinase [Vibrio vulnificus]
MSKRPLAVVAFGGNALVDDNDHCSIRDQYRTVENNVGYLVDLIERGWDLVITHGNGPQVGFILRRSELAEHEVAPVPVDYAVGDTQGAIGYMFQKALTNELNRRAIARPVVSLVTQTCVDASDEAFVKPNKPIGSFMTQEAAQQCADHLGWSIMEDSGRGWRRCVASPKPLEIVELPSIKNLIASGTLVIACGGGGIPVERDPQGNLIGVEAVIDKDVASALLAEKLQADMLIIPTGVEKVAINFGLPNQQWLDDLTPAEAKRLCDDGQFGEGSMKPKVEALLQFVAANPNGAGLITQANTLLQALNGNTGTWIRN